MELPIDDNYQFPDLSKVTFDDWAKKILFYTKKIHDNHQQFLDYTGLKDVAAFSDIFTKLDFIGEKFFSKEARDTVEDSRFLFNHLKQNIQGIFKSKDLESEISKFLTLPISDLAVLLHSSASEFIISPPPDTVKIVIESNLDMATVDHIEKVANFYRIEEDYIQLKSHALWLLLSYLYGLSKIDFATLSEFDGVNWYSSSYVFAKMVAKYEFYWSKMESNEKGKKVLEERRKGGSNKYRSERALGLEAIKVCCENESPKTYTEIYEYVKKQLEKVYQSKIGRDLPRSTFDGWKREFESINGNIFSK